jgi:hypothetical protein
MSKLLEKVFNMIPKRKKEFPLLYLKNKQDGSWKEMPAKMQTNNQLQEALYNKVNKPK